MSKHMINIKNADDETKELYNYLAEIANEIVKKCATPLDDIIKKLSKNIDICSNEELRSYMGKISVEAYNLSMFKEQSSLKQDCADALYKESIAKSYNNAAGTVESKKNQALMSSMDKQAVSILYSSVSNLLKVKTDEAHRLANTLNGILISRSADAKLSYSPRSMGEVNAMDEYNQEMIGGQL